MLSDMELINLQATTSFLYDQRGRMLGINEPEPDKPAPRLFLGRTTAGNTWRFRHDLPASLVSELERLLQTEPIATDLRQPPSILAGLVDTLARHGPVQSVSMGPAWQVPEEVEAPVGVVAIMHENVGVMRRHFPWISSHLPAYQPCRAVRVDGEAVSVCFSSRNGLEAAEAGVNTVEAFRGRGYAPSVVAAWARAVRESNRIPLYSTSWDNLASQAVARKLGLVLYGADLSIT